jgi:hypothetical protein
MDERERKRVGETRRLIFENIANGVPVDRVMETFALSNLEVQKEVAFVAGKIREYRFRRCADGSPHGAPPLPCDTFAEIRQNRKALLETLAKLGPLYLSSDLILPRIQIQKLDHPEMVREAAFRMSHAR